MYPKGYAHVRAVSLTDRVYTNLSRKIKERYPGACVIYVDEIAGPEFKERYNDYCTHFSKCGVDYFEQCGWWHAAREDHVDDIVANGFSKRNSQHNIVMRDVTINLETYTHEESHFLIYCKFAYTKLIDSHLSTPMCPGSIQVDDVANPSIFAVPERIPLVPLYALAFRVGSC